MSLIKTLLGIYAETIVKIEQELENYVGDFVAKKFVEEVYAKLFDDFVGRVREWVEEEELDLASALRMLNYSIDIDTSEDRLRLLVRTCPLNGQKARSDALCTLCDLLVSAIVKATGMGEGVELVKEGEECWFQLRQSE